MCGSDAPDPPDYGPMAEASEYTADLARKTSIEQLAWAKEQDSMNRSLLNEVLGYYLPIMGEQFKNAQEDRKRYEEKFLPWEEDLMREAAEYDSPERRAQMRGEAIQDVNQAFEAQRDQATRRLESYGIDPSQTRNQALDLGMRVEQAKAQAGAANRSDRATEQMGRVLRSDILNIGKGLPSQVAQSYGQVINAGQAGIGGANQTTSTSSGAMTSAQGGFNTALQGYNNSANMMNMGYQNALSGWQADQANSPMSALGSVAGLAMGSMGAGGMFGQGGFFAPAPGGHDGGEVPQDLNPRSKMSPAQGRELTAVLEEGEYIVPREVVAIKGTEFFDRLVERHAPNKARNQAIPTKGSRK